MKRKINKKLLMFGIPILCLMLAVVGAVVVNYLSNTVEVEMEFNSPMEITTDLELPLKLYAGDSIVVNANTVNHATVPVENILIQVKVPNFDGVGITYFHSDCEDGELFEVPFVGIGFCWEGDIPVCNDGNDAYYYIGPAGGFTAEVGYNENSISTITSDTKLEPISYTADIQVVTAASRVC